VARIEQTLVDAGCRLVTWRDWTIARSPDAIAADAMAALADAPTERTASILLDQYHGALARALAGIRQMIDRGLDSEAKQQIDLLRARIVLGQHLVRPWRVVLAGRVNVGKSSLINALAGYGRSIVHPTPGTTRDAVTVTTAIDGWPVELCDTAGLRDGFAETGAHPEASCADPIERAGIKLAQERLAEADLAILVFDRSLSWSAGDQALVTDRPKTLLVHNKCDLPPASDDRPAGLILSARQGVGIGELFEAIAKRLVPNPPSPGAPVPFTLRQVEILDELAADLSRHRSASREAQSF
jgi:tRNA modification GTPase